MALATTVGLEHLAISERPQYGQPYPEGIAVAANSQADDASGGAHTFTINADPGFLYRLELVNWTRGEGTLRTLHAITSHRWAAAKVPFDAASFDLNWSMGGTGLGTFSVYSMGNSVDQVIPRIRRFPMGAALGGGAPGVAVLLMQLAIVAQVDTITNEVAVVWTYWRKEALFLPGFLSAFYEAPAVPPIVQTR